MHMAVTSAVLATDYVGRTIDERFTLHQWLGGTGQNSVFLTELPGHPAQKAVIKLIPTDAPDAETRIAQWAAASTLSHPHLMRLFGTGRCELDGADLLYVVTEYAEEILSDILRERPLTPAETREMLNPILDALSCLHSRNLVHGHLQPSNIMVVDNQLKLSTDRLHVASEPHTISSSTGPWDAPDVSSSPATDVWSLGVVIVQALTQRPPLWSDPSHREPVVPESIPAPFYGIAQQCLQMDPARRCTLSSIRASLDALPSAQPSRKIRPAPRSRTVALPSQSQPAGAKIWVQLGVKLIVTVALVVVGAILAALVVASHQQPSPAPPPQSSAPATEAPQGPVVKGAVTYRAAPNVPQDIRDDIKGHIHVRIALEVDASGHVSAATIDSPGPSQYFANKALAAARQWKFAPAQRGGQSTASQWTLLFTYGLDDVTITPTETSP